MATISVTRDELLQMLSTAKAKADREDAKALAKHQRDERAALKKFREKLREALKWDYETAKRNYMRVSSDLPGCPNKSAYPIQVAIKQVNLDSRKSKFLLRDSSDWYKAATWVPPSERQKLSVCE
jgi:hypothetical protein